MKIPEGEIEKAKDFFVKFVSEGKYKIVSGVLVKMYKETKRIEIEGSERGFLDFLYWKEGKSLRGIGKLFGLTYEGVRLKMIKYNMKRRKVGGPSPAYNKGRVIFESLEEYFEYVKETGKESIKTLHRFLDPVKKKRGCEICGRKRYLRLHYLKRPATSVEDIQVLCITCFLANLREKGINNLVRDEICKRYQRGELGTELAKEYKVNFSNIYQILKIRGIKTRKGSKYSLVEKLRIINGIEHSGEKCLIDSIKKSKISSPTYYIWRKELKGKGILT